MKRNLKKKWKFYLILKSRWSLAYFETIDLLLSKCDFLQNVIRAYTSVCSRIDGLKTMHELQYVNGTAVNE